MSRYGPSKCQWTVEEVKWSGVVVVVGEPFRPLVEEGVAIMHGCTRVMHDNAAARFR